MTRKRKRESDGDGRISAPEGPPAEVEYVPETPPPPDSGGEEEVEGMLGRSTLAAEPDESRPPSSVGESESTVYPPIGDLEHMNLQYPSSSPQPMDVDDPPISAAAVPDEPVNVVNVDEDVSAVVVPSKFYGPAPESRVENGAQVLKIDDEDKEEGEGEGSNSSELDLDKT